MKTLTLVFGLWLLLLENALSLAGRGLIAGVRSSIDVLGEDSELVLVAGREVGDRHQGEPGVADPGPAGHRQLLLLHDVVGDGGSTVPVRHLPFKDQGVGSDLAGLGEPGRVRPVADLDVDKSEVAA